MTEEPTPQHVTVACANFATVWGDKRATLDKIKACVVEAAAQGADIVVFPEVALQGYGPCEPCREAGRACDQHVDEAETVPGPSSEEIAEVARQHDIYVVYGLDERDPATPTTLYNAAAVVGPEGVIGTYRKVHLGTLPWSTEGVTYAPGTELPLFPTRFGPVGIQICFDFWFNPELSRILALRGARLILAPSASFNAPARPEGMRATMVSRAQENLVFVAMANHVGGPDAEAVYSGTALTRRPRPRDYAGHSAVVGPAFPRFGEVLAEAGDTEELICATLNLTRLARFEEIFDYRAWRAGRLSGASRLIADEFVALADQADR